VGETVGEGSDKGSDKIVEKSWERTRQKLGEKLDEKLGETQWKILEIIFEDKYISITTMAEKIGVVTSAIEKNINKLKSKKLVLRIGEPKTGCWKINLPE
jgi:ATP-dependent DNA helicase RecG